MTRAAMPGRMASMSLAVQSGGRLKPTWEEADAASVTGR
jgi:hypothetical protein